jgi:hypothetical protein
LAVLLDVTLSGTGRHDGFFKPVHLYTLLTVQGIAQNVDSRTDGRFLHIGWFAMYVVRTTDSVNHNHYFEPTFIGYEHFVVPNLNTLNAGGFDGFQYQLGAGVSVRFVFTDT